MKAAFSKRTEAGLRPNGISLIELMVSMALVSLLALSGFQFLSEGITYLRVNQEAVDAQRSGLAMIGQVGSAIQGSHADLIASDLKGIVVASAFDEDGKVQFDPVSHKLKWQRWICFYFDGTSVTRRDRKIAVASVNPGTPPTPTSFGATSVFKTLGTDIASFQVSQTSVNPPLWKLEVTIGSMTNTLRYGMELESEVSPRN